MNKFCQPFGLQSLWNWLSRAENCLCPMGRTEDRSPTFAPFLFPLFCALLTVFLSYSERGLCPQCSRCDKSQCLTTDAYIYINSQSTTAILTCIIDQLQCLSGLMLSGPQPKKKKTHTQLIVLLMSLSQSYNCYEPFVKILITFSKSSTRACSSNLNHKIFFLL